MANNYSEIAALTNGKNTMTLTNSIMRAYGIPLDYSSVQETYAKALDYAQNNAKAYIGQLITVEDVLYVVTDAANGYLKPVATKQEGDNKSITVDEDGVVSLYGFKAADTGKLPRKKSDGTIEWVAIDAIVTGDGNEKTRVVAADGSDITVTPVYDSVNDCYTYTLDVRLPAIPAYSITKEVGTGKTTYQVTKDGEAIGEAIVVPDAYNDTALAGRVSSAEAAVADQGGRLTAIEGKVNTFLEAADASEAAIDTLKEIQQYIANDTTGASGMLESIQANTQAIETLNGTGNGSVKQAVDSAIATQAAADAAMYATQETVNAVSAKANAAAVKSEVDTALAGKADAAALENFYQKSDLYTKQEIANLLNNVTGGSQVTAAALKDQLDNHAASAAESFAAINKKNGEQDTAIEENADAIAANADAIAAIVASGTGIYDRAVAAAAADAATQVGALAEGAVKQNTSDISALNNQVSGINNNVTAIGTKVGTLETKTGTLETNLATEIGAREELGRTVATHGTDITDVKGRLTTVEAAAAANTAKFKDYSTTAQVETMIEDAVADIDHTALETGISDNAKAITAEVNRAKAREDEIAGLVSANTTNIGKNASAIAALETTLNAAIENEDGEALNSIKELAAWVSEHESEVLPSIQANTKAIETLNGTGAGSVKKTVDDAIAAIPKTPVATGTVAGIVKESNEVTVTADGVMGIGQVSTDKLVQGNDTLVLNGGNASVVAQ